MWTVLCLLSIYFAVLCGASGPSLDQGSITVNMIAGFTAVLPCTVKNKDGGTRVLWFGPSGNLLTMNEIIRTSDNRISLRRPYQNDWNLRIEQVKYSDRGEYKCKLSSDRTQTKVANLNVLLSPKILTEYSSRDMVAREGSDVELVCNATGVPHPEITWFRKHKDTPNKKENLGTGIKDQLFLQNITREEAGTYECVAENTVDPPDSIAIKVDVQFAPEMDIGVDTLSQMVGKNTVLECEITGFPLEVAVWQYNGIDIEERTWKYEPIVFQRDERTILLSLEIRHLSSNDFGVYTCFASNVIGSANKTKILEEFKITTPLPLRTKSTTHSSTTTIATRATTLNSEPVLSTSKTTDISLTKTTTTDNLVISDKNPSDGPAYTLNPPGAEANSSIGSGQSNSCPSFRYKGWTFFFVVMTTCFILV